MCLAARWKAVKYFSRTVQTITIGQNDFRLSLCVSLFQHNSSSVVCSVLAFFTKCFSRYNNNYNRESATQMSTRMNKSLRWVASFSRCRNAFTRSIWAWNSQGFQEVFDHDFSNHLPLAGSGALHSSTSVLQHVGSRHWLSSCSKHDVAFWIIGILREMRNRQTCAVFMYVYVRR